MGRQSNLLGCFSLICGILSILPVLIFIINFNIGALGSVYFAISIGIVGIVLSRLQSKYADNKVSEAGLITSIIGICLNLIIFVIFVSLFH
jgi:hypothetical protein